MHRNIYLIYVNELNAVHQDMVTCCSVEVNIFKGDFKMSLKETNFRSTLPNLHFLPFLFISLRLSLFLHILFLLLLPIIVLHLSSFSQILIVGLGSAVAMSYNGKNSSKKYVF